MFKRDLEAEALELTSQFPVLAILGPRQSGKTTLAKKTFPNYTYVTLEDPENREFASTDPKGFLDSIQNDEGVIIDEAQYVPLLFSYIQVRVDEMQKPGAFILTGSQNFNLNARISQSLAGRVAILTLLPLSLSELGQLPSSFEPLLFSGGYPRIHAQKIPPSTWYPNYIQTYVERDIRQLKNLSDLDLFQRFIKLCAGRTGQLINWSDLGRDCGITYNTAKSWISLLVASYILFLLPPYYNNFSKRMIKSPKLYFYDTGLACSLLNIESAKQLTTHYLKGALFESFIISELFKSAFHRGRLPHLYFWRDKVGHEIDCLIEREQEILTLEIKSGKTINPDFFKGLEYWQKFTQKDPSLSYLVYGGEQKQKRKNGTILSWKQLLDMPI